MEDTGSVTINGYWGKLSYILKIVTIYYRLVAKMTARLDITNDKLK